LHHPKIKAGDYTTPFIEKELSFEGTPEQKRLTKAIAALLYHQTFILENEKTLSKTWVVVEQKNGLEVKIQKNSVTLDNETFEIDLRWQPRQRKFEAIMDGLSCYGQVTLDSRNVVVTLFGITHTFQVPSLKAWELSSYLISSNSSLDAKVIKAPMPGVLISLPISPGDQVRQGQILMVIEAMKMENAVKSPIDGTVVEILVGTGESVTRNQVLIHLGD